jgi:hypothetical protein
MRFTHLAGLLALASALVAVEGRAQELRGVALDRETKQPVTDARISLLDRRRAEVDTARTASDGSFTLRAKEAGKFFIHVRRSGYPSEETDAIFLKDDESRVDTLYVASARTRLKVDAIVNREVFRIFGVATSSLPEKSVILPDDIASVLGSARTAADVVVQKGPPFVGVLGAGTGRVCYKVRSGNCAAVLVNGQRVLSTTDIPAIDLEAVVILSPFDAQTTIGRNNGVVLLFTRAMSRIAR